MIIFITHNIWLLWKRFLVHKEENCLNCPSHPLKSLWNLLCSCRRCWKSRKYLECADFEYCRSWVTPTWRLSPFGNVTWQYHRSYWSCRSNQWSDQCHADLVCRYWLHRSIKLYDLGLVLIAIIFELCACIIIKNRYRNITYFMFIPINDLTMICSSFSSGMKKSACLNFVCAPISLKLPCGRARKTFLRHSNIVLW